MSDLRNLLERATDAIEPAGGAAEAMRSARRRRTRRRGALVGLIAATAVAAVAIGVQVTLGRAGESAPLPAQTPTATRSHAVAMAPEIDPDRIQPRWDPRGVEGLPVTDLGVPRVMESLTSGQVTRPVAVLDDGSQARLVSADGDVAPLPLPDGVGRWRTVSLSPDGTRLAVVGVSGFFWRPLDGDWRQVAVPSLATGEGIELTWAPGGTSLVLRAHLAGVRVDLDSGDLERLPELRNYVAWTFAPDGSVATVPSVDRLGPLENLQRPVLDERSIAAARANTMWGETKEADDADGLIALDRTTLATRAFLPVPYEHAWYVDGGNLTPTAWLDDDTVAFIVHPKGAAKTYLVTWNVETGDLSRISCWDEDLSAVFATELLG